MWRQVLSRTVFTCFVLAVSALGFALSYWQVERLQWKTALLANIDRIEAADPWEEALDLTAPEEFATGTITGRFLDVPAIRIAPRMWRDQLGAHALTPFQTECCVIWVNRGWVPDFWVEQDRAEGQITLAGTLQSPDVNTMFTPENYPTQGLWYWTDITDMNASIELADDQVVGMVFNLKGQKPEQTTTFPDPVAVDAVRPHNRHLAYAIFWAVMGVVVLVMGGMRLIASFKGEMDNPSDTQPH